MSTIPYTYLLRFLPTYQVYYGVRYREGCHPSELFKSYFTSSKTVKSLIEEYGVHNFEYEVRKTFNDKKSARDWEQKVLIKMNVECNNDFLNQSNNMKGWLRDPGDYSWWYNNVTNESKLMPSNILLPDYWIKNKRHEQTNKNKIIISNTKTSKQTFHDPNEPIPAGWIKGRIKDGGTKDTKWICNDVTKETKLIRYDDEIPEGWRYGNLFVDNKDKIKIWRNEDNDYKCISINPEDLEYYKSHGWTKGQPNSGWKTVFKVEDDCVITKKIKYHEFEQYIDWYQGRPIGYEVHFFDGSYALLPWQVLVDDYKISRDTIIYASSANAKSYKYRFFSCTKKGIIDRVIHPTSSHIFKDPSIIELDQFL